MTIVVVTGVLADALGAASQVQAIPANHAGRNFDTRRVFFSCPSTEYRSTQAARIRVDRDHDPRRTIGELRYLELDQAGKLHAVCEVDGASLETGPWYFSPEVLHRDGTDIELRALAIVKNPASVALGPIEAFPGTLREAARQVVYQHGWVGAIIKRAGEYDQRRKYGEPLLVNEYPKARAERSAAYGLEHRRPDGPLEHSQHRGRILSVR